MYYLDRAQGLKLDSKAVVILGTGLALHEAVHQPGPCHRHTAHEEAVE